MASTNITIRTVQALAPGDVIWDAGHKESVRGFGVRRQRGLPVYVLKYRLHGRQRFLTIGTHGAPWAPDTARREAKKLLGQVAAEKDPADAKAKTRREAADTFRNVADKYLVAIKGRLRPRTCAENERYLLDVCRSLHSRSIHSIRRRQIADCLSEIERDRGAVSAIHARAVLSAMFTWAIRDGYELPANPVLGTNRPRAAKSRERILTDPELRAIWRASGDDDYGRIVRLLILTGQRRDEVGGMRWSEIAGDRWTIPGDRTKNHRKHMLPLVPVALAMIQAQPHRNDRDFIFGEGPRKSGDPQRGFSGWSKSKGALDARISETLGEALMPSWTIHDLRRTCATRMGDRLRVLPHIIEAILNHVSGHKSGVAGIYNLALYADEMREALERWSREVARIVRPTKLTLVKMTAEEIVAESDEAADG